MREGVAVLLAAFNGEKYIYQQISSILSSRCEVDVSIFVAVDPSADRTIDILECFQGQSVYFFSNEKLSGGAKQNFSRLVDYALGLDFRYYAFADQDDVWDSNKIQLSLDRLREMERFHCFDFPLLVFSDSRLVSEDLSLLEPSFMKAESLRYESANNMYRLVLQNVGQGCTMLFNRSLLEMAAPVPQEARMHDHWFMLVACVFGRVGYIPQALVSYRQHSSNVLGGGRLDIRSAIYRALREGQGIKKAIMQSQSQAKVFCSRYKGFLDMMDYDFLVNFGSLSTKGFFYRKWFCLKHKLCMGDALRTLGFYFFV